VRKLPSFEKTPHCLFFLRFLQREKGFGFDQKAEKKQKKAKAKVAQS